MQQPRPVLKLLQGHQLHAQILRGSVLCHRLSHLLLRCAVGRGHGACRRPQLGVLGQLLLPELGNQRGYLLLGRGIARQKIDSVVVVFRNKFDQFRHLCSDNRVKLIFRHQSDGIRQRDGVVGGFRAPFPALQLWHGRGRCPGGFPRHLDSSRVHMKNPAHAIAHDVDRVRNFANPWLPVIPFLGEPLDLLHNHSGLEPLEAPVVVNDPEPAIQEVEIVHDTIVERVVLPLHGHTPSHAKQSEAKGVEQRSLLPEQKLKGRPPFPLGRQLRLKQVLPLDHLVPEFDGPHQGNRGGSWQGRDFQIRRRRLQDRHMQHGLVQIKALHSASQGFAARKRVTELELGANNALAREHAEKRFEFHHLDQAVDNPRHNLLCRGRLHGSLSSFLRLFFLFDALGHRFHDCIDERLHGRVNLGIFCGYIVLLIAAALLVHGVGIVLGSLHGHGVLLQPLLCGPCLEARNFLFLAGKLDPVGKTTHEGLLAGTRPSLCPLVVHCGPDVNRNVLPGPAESARLETIFKQPDPHRLLRLVDLLAHVDALLPLARLPTMTCQFHKHFWSQVKAEEAHFFGRRAKVTSQAIALDRNDRWLLDPLLAPLKFLFAEIKPLLHSIVVPDVNFAIKRVVGPDLAIVELLVILPPDTNPLAYAVPQVLPRRRLLVHAGQSCGARRRRL
mmetsp:Transcript_3191/g.8844  ORF Transcript_3191/g.8844 Transcript_3191/m.8844 type:complete len:670 (+) Transcript_3191:722-2731(+)